MRNKFNNSILTGALALSISAIIVKIIGVVYKIPLTYLLGDTGMGYFNTAYTIYGFFYVIASAGVPKAIAILTAEANSDGRCGEAREIYRKMLWLFLVLGIFLSLTLVLLARPLSAVIGNNKAYITLIAIAPSIVFIAISGVIRGYLNGYSRLLPIAISQFIEAVSKLVLGLAFAFWAIKLSLPLSIASAMTILGITLGSFFSAIYLYIQAFPRKTDEKIGQKSKVSIRMLGWRALKIALPITFSASVLSFSGVVDLGLIMRGLQAIGYTEESATALYGNYSTLAIPMLNLVVAVLTPISVAVLPKLVKFNSLNDIKRFNSCFAESVKATMLVSFPCAFSFLLYSFDILDILFDSSAAAVGAPMLALISLSALLLPYLTILNTALEARGMVTRTTISLLLGVILKSVLTISLIPSIGIYSAPLSSGASYLFSTLISTAFLRASSVAVPTPDIFKGFLISTLTFVPIYLFLYASGICGSGTIAVLICAGASFILYFLVCVLFVLPTNGKLLTSKSTQKTQCSIM